MVGVAVGLGNVWRFPYMMGSHGGSAFLFVYLAFVVLFGVPAVMGEWALGRETRRGTLGALGAALGRPGRTIGALLLAALLVANSYYLVVIANIVYTTAFSVGVGFAGSSGDAYTRGLASGPLQAAIAATVLAAALFVIHLGLRGGIERASKLLVPFFGAAFLYLIVRALMLPGATRALGEFLSPDFSAMDGTAVFAAMGQAFFSLSLGGTFLLAYGSFLRDGERIPGAAAATALGDAGAALLAALFLVPATLVLGIELSAGPTLIFRTLPELFAVLPSGRVLGTIFLLALTAMAFLSTLAALQVLYSAMVESLGIRPGRALVVLGAVETALLLPSAFHPSIIGPLDLLCGSGMQVLGSGVALVALGWGLGRAVTRRQVFRRTEGLLPRAYTLSIRFVVPAALATTLALYVLESIG